MVEASKKFPRRDLLRFGAYTAAGVALAACVSKRLPQKEIVQENDERIGGDLEKFKIGDSQKEYYLNKEKHQVISSNLADSKEREAVESVLAVVTGFPEGAGMISNSEERDTSSFMENGVGKRGAAQIFIGFEIFKIGENLNKFFEDFGDKEIDLVVFSLGGKALPELKEKYWGKIKSLRIVSSWGGPKTLAKDAYKKVAEIASITDVLNVSSTEEYSEQIAGLIKNLQERGVAIEVVLSAGANDGMIDNEEVKNLMRGLSVDNIIEKKRGHSPTENEMAEW